jgi:deoxyadenosine/deoxycytidine kinase
MNNVTVYLIGYFGIGKYSIAKALSELIPSKIIDNHYVLNPIFSLLENDGITPLPPLIWHYASEIRQAILGTIQFLSPREWNFIFTNDLSEDSGSHQLFDDVAKVVTSRKGVLIPILLECDLEEYLRRVSQPERRERMKSINIEEAQIRFAAQTNFQTEHPNTLRLNTTHLEPVQAAKEILLHIKRVLMSKNSLPF